MKSKVYFVASPYMGCNYVRCLLPMWANGWDGTVTQLNKPHKSAQQSRDEMMRSDIIVFHRPDSVEHHKMAVALKQLGKKIVFDNDDTFKDSDPLFKKNYEELMKMKQGFIDTFIRNADLVTTSTKFLAREYKRLNKNVVVLPNCIDPVDWRVPKRNEGEKVRIGIVGSVAYYHDFRVIQDFLKDLAGRSDVQLVMFGLQGKDERKTNILTESELKDEYAFWDAINVEHAPWVKMNHYFNSLNDLKLDLMLIPRKDNYFNRCKSNVKFLEAAMCEIPVIASSFKNGPYEELDGNMGILVKNQREWRYEVDRLIKDKELRRQIGRNAKDYVLDNYSIKLNAHKWAEAYATL